MPSVSPHIWQFMPPPPPSQYISVSHACSSSQIICDGLFPHFWCYPKQWTPSIYHSSGSKMVDLTQDNGLDIRLSVPYLYILFGGKTIVAFLKLTRHIWKGCCDYWINIFIGLQLLLKSSLTSFSLSNFLQQGGANYWVLGWWLNLGWRARCTTHLYVPSSVRCHLGFASLIIPCLVWGCEQDLQHDQSIQHIQKPLHWRHKVQTRHHVLQCKQEQLWKLSHIFPEDGDVCWVQAWCHLQSIP